MAKKKRKTTTDAVKFFHNRYFKDNPKLLKMLKEERERGDVAERIYALRTKARLTQAQLARRVGTTQSVISLLESADYSGHSLEMLRRIANALECQLKIQLVPRRSRSVRGSRAHVSHTLVASS